jgi:RND family efflux transporter MFP subunit
VISASDALAGTWPGAILAASVQGGAVLLGIWLLCRAWRTIPPNVACWLWRIGYLKLLLALVWTAPLRLPLLPPAAERDATTAAAATALAPDDLLAPPRLAVSERVIEPPTVRPEVALAPVWLAGWFGAVLLLGILASAWLIGAGVASARLLCQGVIAVRLRRRARPVEDPAVDALCCTLSARLGLRHPPPVLVHDRLAGPLLLGCFRPAIVLAAPVPEASSAHLRHVLAHELAHVRRRDLWWNVLAAVADVLFFFHPLAWLARREHRLAQESACDEAALAATGAAPADYAGTLLAVATGSRAPAGAFSAGVAGSRKTLERRIRTMFRRSTTSPARRAVAATLVGMVAVSALPPWRVVAQDKPADKLAAAKPADVADGAPSPGGPAPAARASQVQRYSGRLVAETLQLRAGADGLVERLPVRSGERVKKGTLLAELDGRRARAALVQAEARLELAKSQYDRLRSLVGEKNLGSRAELEEKKAQFQVAVADIELRRQDLEETRVFAPFDGVAELTAQAGQRVARGDALGRPIAVDAPRVSFQVPESGLGDVTVGRPVELDVPAYPDRVIKGEISEVSPTVDPETGTVAVVARVTDRVQGLRPGMTSGVTLRPQK